MKLTRFARIVGGDAPWPAWVPAGQRRRLDPLTRLAAAAVDLAIAGARVPPDTGVVVATGYGAVESTHRFARSMAAYGDAGASPTPFTTSVHSSCAGAIGELLGLHGPSTTISQGGVNTVSALRWADLILAAGRAPAMLVLVGDRHNDWSRRLVAELSNSRWPIGDGLVALLAEPADAPAAGRAVDWSQGPAELCLDGGGLTGREEERLAGIAHRRRLSAPGIVGSWWPGCALAAVDPGGWQDRASWTLAEVDSGTLLRVNLLG